MLDTVRPSALVGIFPMTYEEHFGSTPKAMIDGFVIRLLGMHVRVIELLVIP